jgi:hypothetical protein
VSRSPARKQELCNTLWGLAAMDLVDGSILQRAGQSLMDAGIVGELSYSEAHQLHQVAVSACQTLRVVQCSSVRLRLMRTSAFALCSVVLCHVSGVWLTCVVWRMCSLACESLRG